MEKKKLCCSHTQSVFLQVYPICCRHCIIQVQTILVHIAKLRQLYTTNVDLVSSFILKADISFFRKK